MKPLRVLHISTWDNAGGSGRAAYRLHKGLKKIGVDSRMLVGHKSLDDPDVRVLGGRLSRIDQFTGSLFDRAGFHYLFYPSSLFIPGMRWVREADLIQVFNTHGGYFSHKTLVPLSRSKPVVWRLSDMWAFTGHCSYSYECERWKTGCGSCPHPEEYPSLSRDTTRLLWNTKKQIYGRSRLTIVCPSKWLAGLAKQSPLLGGFDLRFIPNGLDIEVFTPTAKPEAKKKFGIDPGRKVILFSAPSIQSKRKGAGHLKEALAMIVPALKETVLFIVGEGAESFRPETPVEVKCFGNISNDAALALAYSAADLFVLPTLADNLPNGILESMACGTPVVSFAVGGVPEAVRQMETGYAASPGSTEDLAKGILLLLEDDPLRTRMGLRCREVCEREYSEGLQTGRFEKLYRELVRS